ncbi:quinone oxidoreductase family protein [Streptomyces mirabilis]
MQAAVIHTLGTGPVVGEYPDPPADQRVAEVVAAALNPVDVVIAGGKFPFRQAQSPFVAGYEGVARLGDGSHRYFSDPELPYGSLAELVPLAGADTVAVPAGLDPATAVALGGSGIAAWLSLAQTGRLRAGESVLILGAGGQVGGIAVQAARLLGAARVVAVVRDDAGRQRALDRGADVAVSSAEAGSLVERLREAAPDGVDLILDAVWGPVIGPAIEIARRGARVVQVGNSGGALATLPAPVLRGRMVTFLPHATPLFTAGERAAAYERLTAHAAAGEVSVNAERVALADTASAWKRLTAGGSSRKLVITPQPAE